MFSVLVIRLRSLRLLRVSGIVMRLRMFLLLITFLKASHSFRNRLLVICKNAYLFADRKSGSAGMPRPISYAVFCLKKKKTRHTLGSSADDIRPSSPVSAGSGNYVWLVLSGVAAVHVAREAM